MPIRSLTALPALLLASTALAADDPVKPPITRARSGDLGFYAAGEKPLPILSARLASDRPAGGVDLCNAPVPVRAKP